MPQKFKHASKLTNVVPGYAGQRKRFEASNYGMLARNASQLEEESVRTKSKDFLQRSLNVIESVFSENPATLHEQISNNPDLKWVRNTREFIALRTKLMADQQ